MFNLQNENTKLDTKNSNQSLIPRQRKDNRKSLTARVKPEDLIIFNQRLKLFGFSSINELVHEFIAGRFPHITEDKQIDNLITNNSSNGQRTVLEGDNHYNFYQSLDLDDMFNYYRNIRGLHPNTCRDLLSYFRRFKDQFFTQRGEELRILSPRIRSKIMDSFRKFGQYYLYK
jgi:hypothetical protein